MMTGPAQRAMCILCLQLALVAALQSGCAADQAPPGMKWRFKAEFERPGQISQSRARFAPTIQQGTLYVVTAGRLHALEIQSGSQRWSIGPVDNVRSFLVSDDRIFIWSASHTSETHLINLQAVDAETGSKQWTAQVAGPVRWLLVVDGVIVAVGDAGEKHAPHYYGIDAGSGETLWQLGGEVLAENARRDIVTDPVIDAGIVYSGEETQRRGGHPDIVYSFSLTAIDANTGNVVNSRNLSIAFNQIGGFRGSFGGSIHPHGDFLYLETDKGILRIRKEGLRGQVFSNSPSAPFSVDSVSIIDGLLYFLQHGLPQPTLRALDVATGNEQWKFEPQAGSPRSGFWRLFAAPEMLYLTWRASGKAVVFALDPITGIAKWNIQLEDASGFSLNEGIIITSDRQNRRLRAYDATTGKPAWIVEAPDELSGSWSFKDGILFFATEDYLYAVEPKSQN